MKAFLLGFFGFYLALAGAAHARDVYVGAYGGGNWSDAITHPAVNVQTGYVVGGVLGVDVPAVPGLYVELDTSFRQNEVNVGPLKVDHDTTAVLANMLYQFPLDFPVRPYLLAGAGYGHSEATLENISIISVESSGLAWQVGGGISARLTDGVTMGAGYRFLQAPSIDVLGTQLSDGTNHSVVAELRVAL